MPAPVPDECDAVSLLAQARSSIWTRRARPARPAARAGRGRCRPGSSRRGTERSRRRGSRRDGGRRAGRCGAGRWDRTTPPPGCRPPPRGCIGPESLHTSTDSRASTPARPATSDAAPAMGSALLRPPPPGVRAPPRPADDDHHLQTARPHPARQLAIGSRGPALGLAAGARRSDAHPRLPRHPGTTEHAGAFLDQLERQRRPPPGVDAGQAQALEDRIGVGNLVTAAVHR